MKNLTYVLALILGLSVTACQVDTADTDAEADGEVTEVVIPEQERQMFVQDVDASVAEFNTEISQLEADLASMPAEVRDEVEDNLQKAREELQEIERLRMDVNQATTVEQWREAREDMWEEVHDVDVALTEAKLEAADELSEFRSTVQSERDELDREITELEAEGENLDADARAQWGENLTELRQQRDEFQQDLQELENATEDNWRDMRSNIVEGWRDLKSTFYSVRVPDIDFDMDLDADVDTARVE